MSSSQKKRKLRTIIIGFVIALIVLSGLAGYFLYQAYSSTKVTQTSGTVVLDTPYVTEFPLWSIASPNGIAVDSKGDAWFVVQDNSSLGVVYANSTMRLFHVPTKGVASWGVAVDNSRNLVWFADYNSDAIWSFNETSYAFKEYPITTNPFAFPFQVAIDSNHNVWFTEEYAGKIGEVLASNGTIVEYPVPPALAASGGPTGLTISPNGTIWFTDPVANSIASFANGKFHTYNFTGEALSPVGIAIDASGNVWFTQHGPSLISEFNPSTGALKTISTSLAPFPLDESLPYFCYIDSQGNVWFNEHQGNRIARYSPSNNTLVEYSIPSEVVQDQYISGSLTMALSPSGVPWFAEWFAGKIGRVNLSEPINQSISVAASTPIMMTNGTTDQLKIGVTSLGNAETHLNTSISTIDFLPPISFSFSKVSGQGNYSSTLTIHDIGLAPGDYYVTIGVFTQDVIVSQLVEVEVP